MNEEIKERWKIELCSGKYSQGDSYLRQWNIDTQQWEYCCLGVLCEMSGLGEWVEFTTRAGDRKAYYYLGSDRYLPDEVAKWAGISLHNKTINGPQSKLAFLNDDGDSFTWIAEELDEIVD